MRGIVPYFEENCKGGRAHLPCVYGAGNVTDGSMHGAAVTKNIFLDSVPAARLTFRNTLRFRFILGGGFLFPEEIMARPDRVVHSQRADGLWISVPLVPEPFSLHKT